MSDQAILRRIGSFTGEQQPICPSSINLTFLSKSKKACTFGRTVASHVRLLSSKMPLMISRHHASITYEREKWMIVDHNVSTFNIDGLFSCINSTFGADVFTDRTLANAYKFDGVFFENLLNIWMTSQDFKTRCLHVLACKIL